MTARPTDLPLGFGASFSCWWSRVYTRGLSPAVRERRLLEVESDVWEQAAEARESGIAPARAGFETFGRAVRGMPADLLWRFQVEGFHVNIHIPFERVAGALMLIMVVAAMITTAANGYDTSLPFDSEAERLADVRPFEARVYTVAQAVAALAMMAVAAVMYRFLRDYQPTIALFSALMLSAAGLIALVGCAYYSTATVLADDWRKATGESKEVLMMDARAALLVVGGLLVPLVLTLSFSIYGFAYTAWRHRLVPRPLGYLVVPSVVLLVLATGAHLSNQATSAWILSSFAMFIAGLWLMAAALWLVFGGSRSRPQPGALSPATSA